jgi:shikimate kinase
MRIFIGGVSCVGKTTIGARLANLLTRRFYDLDTEAELFFGTSIERLRTRHFGPNGFRREMAMALQRVLFLEESRNSVIALPPSGLMGPCWKVVQNVQETLIVVLDDTPENILERVTFYDIDSQNIEKILSDDEKRYHLQEIRGDIRYFKRSWKRAHLIVDIGGCFNAEDAACKVFAALPTYVMGGNIT